MDRLEAWEHLIKAVEEHFSSAEFEAGEYEVHHNNGVGTITLIHRPTSGALELTDTTGSHYDIANNIIMPTDELYDRLHGHRRRS